MAPLRFFDRAMTIIPGQGPCCRCVFKPPPPAKVQTCAQAGIIGVLPGIIGVIQATEVLKYFLEMGDLLIGKMLTCDALTMEFNKTEIRKIQTVLPAVATRQFDGVGRHKTAGRKSV